MSKLQDLIQALPKDSQERIYREAETLISDYRLRLLREQMHLSQSELAYAMGINQSTLSAIENRGTDNKLATIKRYIESLGGKLSLHVDLPGGKRIGFDV